VGCLSPTAVERGDEVVGRLDIATRAGKTTISRSSWWTV
jgi:hypothetical protein